MANRFTFPRETALDANGNPLAGAKLYFYESGTTKPADSFADEALTIANANPVVADSAGRFGDIFLQAIDYKVVLKDAADVTVWTADPVSGTVIATGDKFIPSQQSPADMTVLLGPGTIWDAVTKTRLVLAAQTTALITAPLTNPRNDIVYIDRVSGVVGVQTGTEAVTPVDPTIPDGKQPVARVRLATATIQIDAGLIDDIRELELLGAGTAAVRNTGTAASEIGLNDQAFADVASATTADIGAAASLNVRITGTTTITGLGTVASGIRRKVRFADALILTHNATSLILPGAANITTAADDSAEFISLGSGNWFCQQYKKASGEAVVVVSGHALSAEQATTSGTTIDFVGIPSYAKRVIVMLDAISLSGTNFHWLQLGDSGGIETTGYTGGGTTPAASTLFTSAFTLYAGSAAALSLSGTVELTLMNVATNKWNAAITIGRADAASAGGFVGGGTKSLTGVLDRVRLTGSGSDTFDVGAAAIMVMT